MLNLAPFKTTINVFIDYSKNYRKNRRKKVFKKFVKIGLMMSLFGPPEIFGTNLTLNIEKKKINSISKLGI